MPFFQGEGKRLFEDLPGLIDLGRSPALAVGHFEKLIRFQKFSDRDRQDIDELFIRAKP